MTSIDRLPEPAPLVSVIVLGFNGGRYVDRCLSSLRDQAPGGPSYEVIFFDNASTDGTPERVASAYPWVRLIRSDRNLGFAAGNDAALDHALARHVAFLNQDTVVGRRWVAALLETIHAAGAAIVQSNMILPWQACAASFAPGDTHGDLHVAELAPAAYVAYEILPGRPWLPTLFVTGAGFLVDRTVLPRAGGLFDPDFWAYCEDTDLALRIRLAGQRAAVSRDAVLFHDLTPSTSVGLGSVRKTLRILRNRFLACYRTMTAVELLRAMPVLIVGAAGKTDEIPLGSGRLILAGGMMALSIVALGWAIASMPRHRVARRTALVGRAPGTEPTLVALRRARRRLRVAAVNGPGGSGTLDAAP